MKPISRTVRVSVRGAWGAGAGRPYHPAAYEVLDPADIADVLAAWPEPAGGAGGSHGAFECMCLGHDGAVTLYEASGQVVRSLVPARAEPLAHLLGPDAPDGIPARHRARWVRAAPAGLREYAEALAGSGAADGHRPAVPLAAVFGWLGAPRREPDDAASVLAEAAPLRLLADAPTADLAWAVRETDRAGLEGAVRFFAGEHFTGRHPKRRRVPDTARNLLLAHARSHRPGDLPVLERRLLRGAEDRVRRS
ncbi:hypothetical protein AB0F11_06320 [Streptomyces sp. NPDC032472]|uniref:hypothetical protein n=1 Tax=Streptomyces sp. NPDC032472 TaxID=3155018 RepID=UPI0033F38644